VTAKAPATGVSEKAGLYGGLVLGLSAIAALIVANSPFGPDYEALLRTTGGARVVVEASRVATGEQNHYGFTIHGTRGMLSWDFRRMGELVVDGRPVFAGPGDGEYAAFQPGAGNAMSYDDLKVIEAALFLRSITEGVPHGATLDDAIRAAEILAEISRRAG
jgi:predicted dehydrogenase